MSVDAHIPSSSTQTLPFPVRDMLAGFRIAVLLGHTEVDDTMEQEMKLRTPKLNDMTYKTVDAFLVPGGPIKKLSGLMSR